MSTLKGPTRETTGSWSRVIKQARGEGLLRGKKRLLGGVGVRGADPPVESQSVLSGGLGRFIASGLQLSQKDLGRNSCVNQKNTQRRIHKNEGGARGRAGAGEN